MKKLSKHPSVIIIKNRITNFNFPRFFKRKAKENFYKAIQNLDSEKATQSDVKGNKDICLHILRHNFNNSSYGEFFSKARGKADGTLVFI